MSAKDPSFSNKKASTPLRKKLPLLTLTQLKEQWVCQSNGIALDLNKVLN